MQLTMQSDTHQYTGWTDIGCLDSLRDIWGKCGVDVRRQSAFANVSSIQVRVVLSFPVYSEMATISEGPKCSVS